MTGRCIIVTGASSGLGYEVARYLCEGGNDVILACRSEEKANRAIEKIKRTNPNALATYMQCDLTNLDSIKKFVEDFTATEKKLHVLVNNAGVSLAPKDMKRQFTESNFELTMGTNYLGPFLLTNLLLDTLKKTGGEENGDARIINVAASVHDPEASRKKKQKDLQAMDFDNFFLFNKGSYNSNQAYKNSKAALIMFTYELAKKLGETGVTTNAVCPGFIPGTDLNRSTGSAQKFYQRYVLHGMLRFAKITRSITQGAQSICNLITEDKWKGISGKYVKDGAELKSSEETLEEEKQTQLWELSAKYVAMEGFEQIEVVRPPPEEEEKPKKEKKDEKKEDGEAVKEGEEKAEDAATEGENKEEGETKKEEEEKEETEEKKEETTDKEEIAKEEKQAEETPKEADAPAKEEEKKESSESTEVKEEEKKE